MTGGLLALRLDGPNLHGAPGWAAGQTITVPAALPAPPKDLAALVSCGRAALAGAAGEMRTARAFTDSPPPGSRLPFSYQRIPPWLRSRIASIIGWRQRSKVGIWAEFPRWPVDLSADFLADLAGERSPFAVGPTPVILSHDLDSLEGLENLVAHFLDLEEQVGARSANYIVPCAWEIDHGLLSQVTARGHEVGIHGYDHSGRTSYAGGEERRRRLDGAVGLIERHGVTGYRSPSLIRTKALLGDLGRLYRYDSSIPTTGGLFPVPNNGCASARPFRICGIPEIPLSMPRDGSLRFLGHSPEEILELWLDSAAFISRSGGVVVLLTHSEERFSGNRPMLEIYRAFLETIAQDRRYAWSTPAAVLEQASLV